MPTNHTTTPALESGTAPASLDPAVLALTRVLARQLARREPDGTQHFDIPALVRAVRDTDARTAAAVRASGAETASAHRTPATAVLPTGATTSTSTRLDLIRNHVAGRLANLALRIATPTYRTLVGSAVRCGLAVAVNDTGPDTPTPASPTGDSDA